MKSTELSMIDYSILTTMEKGGDYACYENIVSALENYALYDNPNGFTKNKKAFLKYSGLSFIALLSSSFNCSILCINISHYN